MPTVLFWNLQRKPLEEAVACLAREHAAEMVVLAETEGIDEARLLAVLQAPSAQQAYRALSVPYAARLRLYTCLPAGSVRLLAESDPRYLFHQVALTGGDLLLVSAHLPSKLHVTSERDRANYFARFAEDIRDHEEALFGSDVSRWKTLLIGDLNADPWEPGIVAATCLNAVLARHLARRGIRLYQGREYPVFFNPMWRHLGDATEGPPGSCYFTLSRDDDTSWHLFDQALIRPPLLDSLSADGVRLLTAFTPMGGASVPLMRLRGNGAGTPHRDFSDHLPLPVRLGATGTPSPSAAAGCARARSTRGR